MVKREKKKKHKIKTSLFDRILYGFIVVFLILVAAIMIYPFVNVIAVSLSAHTEYIKSPWMIFPKGFTTDAYSIVLKNSSFWRSYFNSVLVLLADTFLSLFVTITFAWSISRKELKCKSLIMYLVIFCMIFSAGLVPNYLNIDELGLNGTRWALFLPGLFSPFNTIIMVNFFRGLPYELVEAAMIDGASEPFILRKIVVPLSKPVISSISLFLAVGSWNSYFNAQIYLPFDETKWPMSLMLKEMLNRAATSLLEAGGDPAAIAAAEETISSKTMQYASVVIATLPLMMIYPFLQKHFAKGVMVGSIKG